MILFVVFLVVAGVTLIVALGLSSPPPALPPTPSTEELLALEAAYVVIDFETTGLDSSRHEIIEIAAVRYIPRAEVHPYFSTLVKPACGYVPGRITELTGISYDMLLADGIPIEEALPKLLEFCGDLPFVAYNAPFDKSFLKAACKRAGLPAPVGKWSCALRAARRAWPEFDSHRLTAVCERVGFSIEEEHRAVSDCKRTLQVYELANRELKTYRSARSRRSQ